MKRLVSLLLALLLLCAGQAFAGETRAEDFGTGSYHIPVIPIQFPDSPFAEGELELLEAALSLSLIHIYDDVVVVFVDGHVLSDFAQSAQRNDAKPGVLLL